MSRTKMLLNFFISLNVVFYIIPAFLSLFFFKSEHFYFSIEIIFIISLSLLFFIFGFKIFKSHFYKFNVNNIKLSIKIFYFLLIIYLLIVYKIFSENPPALFHLFTGDYRVINELRASATKNKTGLDSLINGLYFTLSYTVVPCILLYTYQTKSKYRNFIFLFFSFIIMLNMQKARIIYLIIPILFLFYDEISKTKLLKYSVILFIFLIIISNLSGFNSNNKTFLLSDDFFIRSTTGSRFIFAEYTSIKFVINRILWIPFITAVDWISYFNTEVNGFLNGATIPVFYNFFGHDSRILIENEVFKYAFEAGDGSLGTANSHFAIDAYVNFGYLGVIFYSFIAGGIISFIYFLLPSYINLIVFNYLYAISFSSLHANFMGGGMWLLIIFILIVGLKKRK